MAPTPSPGSVFISYAWARDGCGRSNRDRVRELATRMKEMAWDVWIDYEQLIGGCIDAHIADGIDRCDVFVVCVSARYCQKVQSALLDPFGRDSCAKEWSYAMTRYKIIQPVVMEPALRHVGHWPRGAVTASLGHLMYVDCADSVDRGARDLHKVLAQRLAAIRRRRVDDVALPKLSVPSVLPPSPRFSNRALVVEWPRPPATPRAGAPRRLVRGASRTADLRARVVGAVLGLLSRMRTIRALAKPNHDARVEQTT